MENGLMEKYLFIQFCNFTAAKWDVETWIKMQII